MTAPCTCARCPRVACCSASCACGPDYAAATVAHDVPRGRRLYERDRAPRQTRGLRRETECESWRSSGSVHRIVLPCVHCRSKSEGRSRR